MKVELCVQEDRQIWGREGKEEIETAEKLDAIPLNENLLDGRT